MQAPDLVGSLASSTIHVATQALAIVVSSPIRLWKIKLECEHCKLLI